jgi:hypothetical protein
MELDAFTCRLGDGQGRVATPDGEVRFVLGDTEPGRLFDLVAGDRVEVAQSTDLTGVALVRAILRMRVPKGVPAGLTWEASVVVDGVKRSRMTCAPGRTRSITDLAANVSKLTGPHDVGVRLELVAV